ncbi:MAG TPA: DUF131 domain-containing protein [Thermoplasmata archaeon]|nr:DUF131 domain-containing protein [Thermoplasmata archaeon]
MRAGGYVALAAIVAGAALIVDAVAEGRALVSLVVFIPVVSGSSAEFLLGVVLLAGGLVSLPWSLAGPPTSVVPPPPERIATDAGAASGGVVLIGPVPILFGSWRNLSARARWILALVGAGLLVLFVLGWLWLVVR